MFDGVIKIMKTHLLYYRYELENNVFIIFLISSKFSNITVYRFRYCVTFYFSAF